MNLQRLLIQIPGLKNRKKIQQYEKYQEDYLLHIKLELIVVLKLKVDYVNEILHHHFSNCLFASQKKEFKQANMISSWLLEYCSERQIVSIIKSINPLFLENFTSLGELIFFVSSVYCPEILRIRVHRRIRRADQLLSTLCYLLGSIPEDNFVSPAQLALAEKFNQKTLAGYSIVVPVEWKDFEIVSHNFLNCLGGQKIKNQVKNQDCLFLVLEKGSKKHWVLSLNEAFEILECRGFLNTRPRSDELNKIIKEWSEKIKIN